MIFFIIDGPLSRQIDTERSDFPPNTARRSDMPTQRGEFPPTHRTGFSSHYDDADEEFESVSQISGDQRVSGCTAASNSHPQPSSSCYIDH